MHCLMILASLKGVKYIDNRHSTSDRSKPPTVYKAKAPHFALPVFVCDQIATDRL
jgi:hypothetical protein